MSTFATLPAKERELFFRQYQETRGVDPVIAEKDFWVCWLLGRIFAQPQLADACVFKGGTSLSKVFGAIERFSEDIDLAIIPASLGWKESDLDQAPSRTKREERMAELETACAAAVQATWQPLLEASIRAALGAPAGRDTWLTYLFDEAGRSPVLYFAYPGALPRSVAYIAREVKIEFGSLTDQRPVGRHPIRAFVAELAPGAFADFDADVVALELERTFWEKATILHAEFHRPADRQMKDRHARHYADFASLWRHPPAQAARSRLDLLERVRLHKSRFFSSSWANYATAVPGSLRLVPPAARVEALRADYQAMRQMFLNEPTPFDQVLAILREAETELNRS
ncbi:MAG: nucleotidyl transferase AbiEii/AbiGii toxin family protein [Akkermansiaceae bacterium]|jgi:hypothetical protein|nr:nucleotidyl transferase AbiEii/AbiGii toxin family protein [Akkermansiaceae bacterium]